MSLDTATLVYSPHYDLGVPALEGLHPFDGRKFSRAFAELRRRLGDLADRSVAPPAPASDADLRLVHPAGHLASLKSAAVVTAALELPALSVPDAVLAPLLDRAVLTPMRWAVAGTATAARAALTSNRGAVNLGGGFHHAKPERAEGFCLFADVAVAVRALRREGLLAPGDPVAHVDLDAHRGNGVATVFADDSSVRLLDLFNADIYPYGDRDARARIDRPVELRSGTSGARYLGLLREHLPAFLAGFSAPPRLAFVNAGTDVVADDPLGGLALSADDVAERDRFVLGTLSAAGIPWVMVTSGGYTDRSWRLVADTVAWAMAPRA